MAIKIRLARGGRKKKPFYKVVVAQDLAPRDGRFIEKLGTYNPLLPKGDNLRVVLVAERIAHWLAQGAQPTEIVAKMIKAAGITLPVSMDKNLEVKAKARKIKLDKELAEKAAKAEAEANKEQAA
jgi:small subunit ribosomal protein S16